MERRSRKWSFVQRWKRDVVEGVGVWRVGWTIIRPGRVVGGDMMIMVVVSMRKVGREEK
jgi:hypothetical protein